MSVGYAVYVFLQGCAKLHVGFVMSKLSVAKLHIYIKLFMLLVTTSFSDMYKFLHYIHIWFSGLEQFYAYSGVR